MKAFSAATYAALRSKVSEVLLTGQRKIEEAKVRTYWETGRLIKEHILAHKDRADYGARVIERLAGDLDIDVSVLKRIRKFYELFPKGAAGHLLSWAHYRVLVGVADEKKRLAMADRAAKEEWDSHELQRAVRDLNWNTRVMASDGAPSLLTVPALGPFYAYKIIAPETADGRLLIDLGFSCNRYLDAVTSKIFRSGDIVTSVKDPKENYKLSAIGSKPEALYVYRAKLEKIVDGDTLRVVVDLGFDTTTRQYIRLRAIDCPEMDTAEGKAAKRFVENALQNLESITLRTVKPDKYDRYLGDVFYLDKTGKQEYLNNRLLEAGHAVRVRE